MSTEITPELLDAIPEEIPFEIPDDLEVLFTPDELRRKMGEAAWKYSYANTTLNGLASMYQTRKRQTRIILLSKQIGLIQNERLRAHLELCFQDPKFKFNLDDIEACIFIEHLDLMSNYERFERIAKQAKEEHDMWQKQLMWYQSKMKHDTLDGMGDQTHRNLDP